MTSDRVCAALAPRSKCTLSVWNDKMPLFKTWWRHSSNDFNLFIYYFTYSDDLTKRTILRWVLRMVLNDVERVMLMIWSFYRKIGIINKFKCIRSVRMCHGSWCFSETNTFAKVHRLGMLIIMAESISHCCRIHICNHCHLNIFYTMVFGWVPFFSLC